MNQDSGKTSEVNTCVLAFAQGSEVNKYFTQKNWF